MAKKDAVSKRLAEARARYTLNLQRAFGDLVPKLKRAYRQPARNDAEARSQHAVALLGFAHFLKQMGPDYLADCADQLAKLAQTLMDVDNGIPIRNPAIANRSDQTVVWLARAYVALAVETMRRHVGGRKSAAKWAARKHPGLKRLITESGPALERGKSLETAIISWCGDFSSGKVKNHYATRVYSEGLSKLKAWAPNRNSDQMEDEADRLLREALGLICRDEIKVGIYPP